MPKTVNELEDNEEYAKRLFVLSGPEKLGGLNYPADRNQPDGVGPATRIKERIPLIKSEEYSKWYMQTYNVKLVADESGGGGSNG